MKGVAFVLLLVALVAAVTAKQKYYVTIDRADNFKESTYTVTTIEPVATVDACALVWYDDSMLREGWDNLVIDTAQDISANCSNEEKMFAAGYAEGFLLYRRAHNHRKNIFDFMLKHYVKSDTWAPETVKFVKENFQATVDYANDPANDSAVLIPILNQFYGVVAGYQAATAGLPEEFQMTLDDMWFYQAAGDLLDIYNIHEKEARPDWQNMTPEERELAFHQRNHCSALISMTDDDLFMSQVAWFTYTSMTKTKKTYRFDMPEFAAKTVTMASYPLLLFSFDDFYVTDQKLAVFETTNEVFNTDLYDLGKHTQLLTWIRAIASTRVASTGPEFAAFFSKNSSATYNNQYAIVDYKVYKNYKASGDRADAKDLLTIVEQAPGKCMTREYTDNLFAEGNYFPSFNIAAIPEMWKYMGYDTQPDAESWSWSDCPRAKIFRAHAGEIKNYDDFKAMMRYNKWQTDPLSQGNAGFAIASRYDLRKGDLRIGFGGQDAKTVSSSQILDHDIPLMDAICSPTYDDQEPWVFDHAQWPEDLRYAQEGFVEGVEWKFEWTHDFPKEFAPELFE